MDEPVHKCDPKDEITFSCTCGRKFKGPPTRTAEAPERQWHPVAYFGVCPDCGMEAEQAAYEVNLFKAWAHATGPRTQEGKETAAANLEGYPTAEQMRVARFNAMKHGAYARTATFFPAKPGGYPQCAECEYDGNGCGTAFSACMKRAELWLRHHIAFESRDPGMLTLLRADLQAGVSALMEDMLLAILQVGPQIEAPAYYSDKDGGLHWVGTEDPETGEFVPLIEYSAHPLLKPFADLLAKNGMSLTDLGMTPKAQDDHAEEMGNLAEQRAGRETLQQFVGEQRQALKALPGLLRQAQEDTRKDPVLAHLDAEDG